MIVEVRDDTLVLSGSLAQNRWNALAPAVRLLMRRHPEGVILDCTSLQPLTPEGTETFRAAEAYVTEQAGQLVVAGLSPEASRTLRAIPNLGSRLPLAEDVSQARTTLGLKPAPLIQATIDSAVVLLGTEADGAAVHAALRSTTESTTVLLLVPLLVPRDRSLLSALGAEEESARARVAQFQELLQSQNRQVLVRVERTRDTARRTVVILEELAARRLILGVPQESEWAPIAQSIAQSAPCPTLLLQLPQGGVR